MKQNKTLHRYVGYTFHVLMLTLLFLWCGSTTASAVGAGTKEDPYVLEDGATYEVVKYKGFYAKFTAPSAGTFKLGGVDSYSVYTDETFGTIDESISPAFNGDYGNIAYTFECQAGKTYYVGNNFVMNGGTATFKFITGGAEPVELKSCSPKEGSVINAVTGKVDLAFNQSVRVGGCTMTCCSLTVNPEVMVTLAYAGVDIKNQLVTWYNDGSIKEGDDIKIKFTGISAASDKNTLYNGDGVLELAYKVGPKSLMLVSSTNTPASETPVNDFKSYYMSSDATGMIMLTFSGEVGSIEAVKLQYGSAEPVGDSEASEYYEEDITPPNILGNTVALNLKGKLRRPADMLPGVTTTYSTINLLVRGVKDVNGNYAYSAGQGTIGTYGFNFNYKDIAYDPVADWAVVDGDAINSDTKNIELWLKEDGDKATFTGVEFAYKDNGTDKTAVVEAKALTITDDPDEATAKIITIPVPNVSIDANSKVTVSLAGVETPSGVVPESLSGTFDCTGKAVAADELQIISAVLKTESGDVEMVNGQIGTIARNAIATITLNKEVGYITWSIDEPESPYIKNSYQTPNASSFDITIRGAATKFLAGKTYTFTLKAWTTEDDSRGGKAPNIGTATFTFTGTETPYVYSDVTLLNHISKPYPLVSKDQNTYTLEFSGPATVKKAVINTGMGSSADCAFEAVQGSDDKQWVVTLAPSVLNQFDAFDLNVFAEDKEHHAINKAPDASSMGSEDNTWLTIPFSCDFNKPDFTVEPASESVLESIDKITFSYNGGINVSYDGGKINIWCDRQLVKEIKQGELKRPEGEDTTDKLCVVFAEPITAAGNYTVEIPAGFFVLGEEFSSYASKATSVYYEVKAATGVKITVTPESESTLESIDKIVFTYEPGINVNWNSGNDDKITIYNKASRTEVASFTKDDVKLPEDFFDVTNVRVELTEPITAAGNYEVTVPAGFFSLGESGNDLNEAMVIYYEIAEPKEELVIAVNPAGGTVTEIPATIVLTAEGRETANFADGTSPVLTDDKSNTYAAHYEWGTGWNEVNVVLEGGAINAAGTYTLTIPAGSVYGNDETDTFTKDIVITYIIENATGIDNIVANAGGKVDVYTINGTNVLCNADAAAVKTLNSGLYIIDGKKVVIKK